MWNSVGSYQRNPGIEHSKQCISILIRNCFQRCLILAHANLWRKKKIPLFYKHVATYCWFSLLRNEKIKSKPMDKNNLRLYASTPLRLYASKIVVLYSAISYWGGYNRHKGEAESSLESRVESRGGVLPYMGYIGTCRGIGYGFWRFSILK